MNLFSDKKGQLSVFLAVILLIIVGLMAFIVNIGIFVKSKINLQNAVDAAAYSGAATQARQLTQIAYMNWEMRNTYKEWLFKYYVLGQLSNPGTENIGSAGMDFRLPSLAQSGAFQNTSSYRRSDPWNIPSICIDIAGSNKICSLYSLPGLPKFESSGAFGIDEINLAFLENLSAQKSSDCSDRSELNFSVATRWTYGLGESSLSTPTGGASPIPQIALDRPGSFPKALEAAIRVRNLERIVNEPPKLSVTRYPSTNPLCEGSGCRGIEEFESREPSVPIHERTVKAFWAGFRNLAKSPDQERNSLKNTFVLSELHPSPKEVLDFDTNLSAYLMKNVSVGDYKSSQKYYVDLQIQLVNYAIFFNLFQAGDTGDGIRILGYCNLTKVAIPVPGYPLGFIKNPNILTYYSVKGEAYFTGLFNPFRAPIKMVAYSSAKPFGGRIGPHIFKVDQTGQQLTARGGWSSPYITGIKVPSHTGASDPVFKSLPIPREGDHFWVGTGGSDVVGGVPVGSSAIIKFGVPNMPFDFLRESPSGFTSASSGNIEITSFYSGALSGSPQSSKEAAGLYSSHQFSRFKPPSLQSRGAGISRDLIEREIINIRRPTSYEAANYLIPTLESDHKEQGLFSIGPIASSTGAPSPSPYNIYAPLIGEGLLFQSINELEDIIQNYLGRNESALRVYMRGLKQVAVSMASQGSVYVDAAKSFHKVATERVPIDTLPIAPSVLNGIVEDPSSDYDDTCDSIAGKFSYLYLKKGPAGGNLCFPFLGEAIIDDWKARDDYFYSYYQTTYVRPLDVASGGGGAGGNGLGVEKYMTGYMPGPLQGASEDRGHLETSFTRLKEKDFGKSHRRNHYSVKFVPTQSLTSGSSGGIQYGQGQGFSLLGERLDRAVRTLPSPPRFENPLRGGDLGEFLH